ncbi:MAG: hypothetical protein AB1352_05065 [Patescibacteria group bacterium]
MFGKELPEELKKRLIDVTESEEEAGQEIIKKSPPKEGETIDDALKRAVTTRKKLFDLKHDPKVRKN